MSLKRIVINASCVMFAVLAGVSMLIINDQTNMYRDLHNDYITLSDEYDRLSEEYKNKAIAVDTLQDTIAQMERESK